MDAMVRDHPPGSAAEIGRFAQMRRALAPLLRRIPDDPAAPRTVVVGP